MIAKFGFIVIDGSGALFGTLQGNTREVLHKLTLDLPKKHGRGVQSALCFARLWMEKRHNYVGKVAETTVQLFISGDKVSVAGLILAGSADFKTELRASLVAQWLRICLPMQGTRVRALVWEDPTCRGATGPVSHNYWAWASGACAPQQKRPRWWGARAPRWRVAPARRN